MSALALPAAVRFQGARQALDAALAAAQARLRAAPGEALDVDLSGTHDYDSSLVALMLALARGAADAGGRVRFVGVPPNLAKLAALYGVDQLLLTPPRRAEAATP